MATWIVTQTADAQLMLRPVTLEKSLKNQRTSAELGSGLRESMGNSSPIKRLR